MATSASGKIRDALVSHSVDMAQYANGVARRMARVLDAADADLVAALRAALERLDPSAFTVRRLAALLASVRTVNAAAYARLADAWNAELRGLAAEEVVFQHDVLSDALPPAARTLLRATPPAAAWAAAESRPLRGRLLSEWARDLAATRARRLQDYLAVSYVEGRTVDEMVRGVRGTRANGFRDGILQSSRRDAEAVVRTAVAHVAAEAREAVYAANGDLVGEVVWDSTLDTRTTEECQVRDGRRYSFPDHVPLGHQVPWLSGPGRLHWGCRSTSHPVLSGWKALGIDLPPAQRASLDGAVPAGQTYGDWLRRQSAERQDEVLGPKRGILLRSGALGFDRFFDDKGIFLTLDELRKRNAAAFRRTGE